MRLISSASVVRHEASYMRPPRPTTGMPEPQLSTACPLTEPSRCDPSSTACSDVYGQQWLEQNGKDAVKPLRSRPSSRRSIGGAALRVARPDSAAPRAQQTAAVSMLGVAVAASEQSKVSGRPPVPMRTSSSMSASGRLPPATGAARLQSELHPFRRSSAARASVDEGTFGACCEHLLLVCPLLPLSVIVRPAPNCSLYGYLPA